MNFLKILRVYYLRMGFLFGRTGGKFDDNPLFPQTAAEVRRCKGSNLQLAGTKSTTNSNLQQKMQRLLDESGNSHIKFTTKSFKVTGVTAAFHADIPSEKIKLLGRWASESVINRYR